MDTEVQRIRARSSSRLIAIVAACSLLTGCDDGPTAPGTRQPATPIAPQSTPTPIPVPNVAGTWNGTFHPGGLAELCGSESSAAAKFSQDGSHLTGTVTTQHLQFRSSTFEGSLQGSHLSGTLRVGTETRSVTGSAFSNNLTMRFGFGLFCQGRIDLNRLP